MTRRLRLGINISGIITLLLATFRLAAGSGGLTEDDIRWRERIGYNPQVHGTVPQSSDNDVIRRVPYAYYPTDNQIEVIFDFASAVRLLPEGEPAPTEVPDEVWVEVYPHEGEKRIARERIALDGHGRGPGLFTLPELEAGWYRVQYVFGGATLPSSRTFRRTFFPFEGNDLGSLHKVYPPFEPVQVQGDTVSVVDRTYRINALGLLDSVVSKGRELLAAPMRLVGETVDGRQIVWQTGRVEGREEHPDLAVFETRVIGEAGDARIGVRARLEIEEDGHIWINMTLLPEPRPSGDTGNLELASLFLEMAMNEDEAPLCHLVGMNSMRHNYAGYVPRGGDITWINQSWRPSRFVVTPFEGAVPDSYPVWESRHLMHWHSERWNFAPYIWLGAEERGLAWFGDHTGGYSHDGRTSLQRLFIEPGRVVLRVSLIQKPVALDAPRTFEFGLQASPTKPMMPNWRGYDVPGGGGMPVVVWGGFNCASKYPVNQDWSIVDKIMEGRGSGKVDTEWFEAITDKYQLRQAKANGTPWLEMLLHFANREANMPNRNGTTVYFEEHQTAGDKPEMIEYMDEWADTTWSRFRYYDYSGWFQRPRASERATWGPEVRSANSSSHRDFVVYMANEWMRRGVGIYYDNTYPMTDYNRQHFDRDDITWSSSIRGHRQYYRRVWKQSRELMERGLTPLDPVHQAREPGRRMRLHIVGHVTNCQVLPFTTWWDATLGVEQPGQWIPENMPSVANWKQSKQDWPFMIIPTPRRADAARGQTLPLPPDYLRAMEMGRTAGLIPYYRHALRSEDAFDGSVSAAVRAHRELSDAAMGFVHEIRGGVTDHQNPAVGALRQAFRAFGYGRPDVAVHNYWDEEAPVDVADTVKWIALAHPDRQPSWLVLLQSYTMEAQPLTVRVADAAALLDVQSRALILPGADGRFPLELAADYGTRLLLAADDPAALERMVAGPGVISLADFEFGLTGFGWQARGGALQVVDDEIEAGNRVLRVRPGHPSSNYLKADTPANAVIRLRFRLPEAKVNPGNHGVMEIKHRWNGDTFPRAVEQKLVLNVRPDDAGKQAFSFAYGALDGEARPGLVNVEVQTLGRVRLTDPNVWHTLEIAMEGSLREVRLDGAVILRGETDRAGSTTLDIDQLVTELLEGADPADEAGNHAMGINPGWESERSGLPYVEVDDIMIISGTGGRENKRESE